MNIQQEREGKPTREQRTMNNQIKNIGTSDTGIDESVVALFEENTVTGEKASANVAESRYTSETRQEDDDNYVYIVKKNRKLLCVSCYNNNNGKTTRYWGVYARDVLSIIPKVSR